MTRRMIALATVLLMVAAALLAGCSSKAPQQTETVQTIAQEQEDVNVRKTVLYFRDASGYIVPVMKKLPMEEGIAKAALKCLVAGTDEDTKLAAMGVTAPVPKGTTMDLDIADSKATVNLKMSEPCKDKAAEQGMVASVVNTLLEFSTVKSVALQVNGQDVQSLPAGAEVKASYDAPLLNIEPAGAPDTAEGKLELCFANSTGRLVVPVYRVAGESVELKNAIAEMLQPAEGSGLVSLFPPSCDVLNANITDKGVAEIEFSKEFSTISDTPAMETMALRALNIVCKQFSGVKEVKLIVDGKAYEPSVSTSTINPASGGLFLNYYD